MFDATSRYAHLANATLTATDPDGNPRVLVYKRRRFIPSNAGMTTLLEHTFRQGERLDNITARYLGDPLQFWRICDANIVLQPEELESIGRPITIAVPGI